MVRGEILGQLHLNADTFHPGVKSPLHIRYHWGDKYDSKEVSKDSMCVLCSCVVAQWEWYGTKLVERMVGINDEEWCQFPEEWLGVVASFCLKYHRFLYLSLIIGFPVFQYIYSTQNQKQDSGGTIFHTRWCVNISNEFQIYFETHGLLLETLFDSNKLTAHFLVKTNSRTEY